MTDVSAQAFRDMAEDVDDYRLEALLLAAAEQREQLDVCQSKATGYEVAILNLTSMLNRTEQQLATLTAEKETLRHQWETTRATLIDVQTYAQKQIATLTAERGALTAANKSLDAHCMVLQHDIRTCLAESDDEPREQLLGELSQQVVDLGLWNASQRTQIATLTAERDAFHTHAVHLREHLDTLTAERDEARAKLAEIRARVEDTGSIDTFRVIQILNAPTTDV